ncbi:DUF72 domain-containing protein [Sphingosinicella soli]|uniref:Uncharacterized protein YecE (DUF72 family) n=1 Tax=Sphingosinicella soli TaxID=333708 RepID=A0A7W7B6A0_9SPHN|nr:DUF72 domain-containing protein [Sphingosinicella soli]MBB4633933.1 uncharacterized protein YecE (DUF72 family) [Sphingosinicella soli]
MAGGRIRVGIGGWTYAPWRGTFYPEGLPQTRELEHAAARLGAIEINGTFYSSFKPASFAKWAEAAPEGFVFTVKASRFTTVRKVLGDGAESVSKFLGQGLEALDDKLGPILWQFPHTKAFDAEDFAGFLKLLPEKLGSRPLRHALEVRHASFEDTAFVRLAKDAGTAIVYADKPGYPTIDEPTADFAYARLQRAEEDVATGYTDAALDDWAAKARGWASGGRDTFVFMINGAKVRAPAAAQALIARL